MFKQPQKENMALSIALSLSDLEPEHFSRVGVRYWYEQGARCLTGNPPMSPTGGSESSGFSSLTPSLESATNSSRPSSPEEETAKQQEDTPLRIFYKERDILNLGANIREPCWLIQARTTIRQKSETLASNSITKDSDSTEECSTKDCSACGFMEPTPYLYPDRVTVDLFAAAGIEEIEEEEEKA